jgi:chemotaxis protein MotB
VEQDEAGQDAATPHQPIAAAEQEATTAGVQAFDPSGKADTKSEHPATKQPGAGQSDSTARVSPDARAMALVGTKTQAASAIAARAAADEAAVKVEMDRRERASFDEAAQQIRDAIRGDKLLADFSRQIAIDQTPEGLRIQLLDEDRSAMFALGSSTMADNARLLLNKMAPVLAGLSEPIAVSGHTDAAPYRSGDKTNWELSAERANATRRILVDAGLKESRFRSVTGNADRDLLLPADPLAASNRRIAILILRVSTPRASP